MQQHGILDLLRQLAYGRVVLREVFLIVAAVPLDLRGLPLPLQRLEAVADMAGDLLAAGEVQMTLCVIARTEPPFDLSDLTAVIERLAVFLGHKAAQLLRRELGPDALRVRAAVPVRFAV